MVGIEYPVSDDVLANLPTIDSPRRVYLEEMITRFYCRLPRNTIYNAQQARAIAERVVNGAIRVGRMAKPDDSVESQRRREFATALLTAYIQTR